MKKLLMAAAAIIIVIVIVLGVARWLEQRPSEQTGAQQPPLAQPEHCADVEFISAPGTWESNAVDDPFAPQANPNSLMLQITNPLTEQFQGQKVKIWTLPYTAQFRNINAQDEMSYDDSREEGIARVEQELRDVHAECPQTDFILAGFSQGAVLLGDVANKIGVHGEVIPAERIRGVALLADGRRVPEAGQFVGNPVAGVGAEVALEPVNLLVQPIVPGATMRGPRDGGFGVLNDRVMEICAPDDTVCDAPRNVVNGVARARQLIESNGVHGMYATNPNVIPGTTAVQWVIDWARDLIQQ
ncbi:cutinase family protein [Corynebacterium pseudopelargi]|uniref:Cutinase n=1 Tax=Corynebacterium pseudopelargi TaxID=2080757 RepID=A0A3G6IRZ4_9CORY|nr:cutinase family protein [Corynebacterium pseudopelargi]AZA08323.1 Cutinase [Corynebacterium pseudopelargi]